MIRRERDTIVVDPNDKERQVNITNPSEHIADHFTVKEAIWLPQWNRLAKEADGLNRDVQRNLLRTFDKMDTIRHFFNRPIIVHSGFRSKAYNQHIGGAPKSAHVEGLACDFHVDGLPCDIVRLILKTKVEEFGVRLEWKPGSNWVHLDLKCERGGLFNG